MRSTLLLSVWFLWACGETGIRRQPLPPVADPPERALDLWGTPPSDWNNCFPGFRGLYTNLHLDHPDVERPLAERPPEPSQPTDDSDVEPPELELPFDLDWWDPPLAFERYDASTDFGPGWWPVDEGFEDDPLYYGVRWIGWLRITRRGQHEFVLGAASDAWVMVNDRVIAELTDREAFEPESLSVHFETGVYRLEVRYAQRLGSRSGFRLRWVRDGLRTCYPEYGDPIED
ncbi:MAG: hypothetical protein EA397_06805 [Deltaproteobacteria bacterium]|nr:MAG: hypothetical protein EA397_06805 [Deltaproteobacteria bacterium]